MSSFLTLEMKQAKGFYDNCSLTAEADLLSQFYVTFLFHLNYFTEINSLKYPSDSYPEKKKIHLGFYLNYIVVVLEQTFPIEPPVFLQNESSSYSFASHVLLTQFFTQESQVQIQPDQDILFSRNKFF